MCLFILFGLFQFASNQDFFISVLGSLIFYKYKGKLTPEEMEQRELEKYKYILNKIKITQESSVKEKQHLLSGQPLWTENVY
jgi:hypothetical protein